MREINNILGWFDQSLKIELPTSLKISRKTFDDAIFAVFAHFVLTVAAEKIAIANKVMPDIVVEAHPREINCIK